ncbi:tannase/feruloyl esterase family alpha/beta hydrolase [Novosphingobium malaysiense]|uniref:tannase/feruloyl esterase family alpha/beta hydrolase n=1 Tax=Novosphingobium malaysiense TaxID=1348853 RepID=UPI000690C0FD|nr:tannase/feruloyl esterase family alpha/beta hydrolase [Novosphingobium malaysiense]
MLKGEIRHIDWQNWMSMEGVGEVAGVAERCTIDFLQPVLSQLGAFEVMSARINRDGEYQPPFYWTAPINNLTLPKPPPYKELPDFCEVQVRYETPGGHEAHIYVWAPLVWNGRYLGTAGGSSQTVYWREPPWPGRNPRLSHAIRNGFASATTDGGNRDARFFDWAIVPGEDSLNEDLILSWAYRATHEMTKVAKAVIEALYGEPPAYSYLAGCSGGGRMTLSQAQHHPDDYDGFWAADPAVHWGRTIASGIWPALVMKERGVALADAKLDAFRDGAAASCPDRSLADGIAGPFDRCTFDPRSIVGNETEAGTITEADAAVMQEIWDGPRRPDGTPLWFGLRPGVQSWGMDGLCRTETRDGKLVPVPFELAFAQLRWSAHDEALDWDSLTFERYAELFESGLAEVAPAAGNDPDLSGLAASGAKLLLTQGADDDILPSQGCISYYESVLAKMGGHAATVPFARFFLTEGDGHAFCINRGPGLTNASAMIALMEWVEQDKAPAMIVAERFDRDSFERIATRPAYLYPCMPVYRGEGDPNEAESFTSSCAVS